MLDIILNDIEEWMNCNNVRDYPIKENEYTNRVFRFVNLTTAEKKINASC